MKRILLWVIIGIIVISVIGCNPPAKQTTNTQTQTTTTTPSSETTTKGEIEQIQNVMKLAKQGKTTNTSNFHLLSTRKTDIIKQWGKPDNESKSMIFYQKKEARFYLNADSSYNDKDLVVGIDSYDSKNNTIHLKTVEQTLGKPLSSDQEQGNYMIHYNAGQYLLSFSFSNPSKENSNPTAKAVRVEIMSN